MLENKEEFEDLGPLTADALYLLCTVQHITL